MSEADSPRARLERYAHQAIDDGQELVCASAPRCRGSAGGRGTFAAGQLSHVGSHYAADDHHGLRILVVGKQTGRGHEHVTMEARSAQVASAKPLAARPSPRTPHMDGTAAALKVLLGADPGGGDDVRGVHVFDRFALANATLCSHIPTAGSTKGQGTSTMYQRCAIHLRRTVELLDPTVIVAQGWSRTGWCPSRVVAAALGLTDTPPRNSAITVRRPQGPIAFVALVHPSMNWAGTGYEMFRTTVAPLLGQARDTVLRGR